MRDPTLTLIGLGLVALVAIGVVAVMLRLLDRNSKSAIVEGYPPHFFPHQELTHAGPLADLAATQLRLLKVYRQLPPRSEASVWLWAFLGELRAIMDSAYRVAGVTTIYGDESPLVRVAAEVHQFEHQLVDRVVQQMLHAGDGFDSGLLDARLATLRRFTQEMGALAV